jgi:twitching motility protein PilI
MSGSSQTPLERLVHLQNLCLERACGLPQQEQTDEEWLGIGFRLGKLQLVAPLGEVAEILTPPGISRVPRTKNWVCGIANVRGNLMPIMDLQGYLYDRPAALSRHNRILVVNHNGVYSGLVVDAVLGLRHFSDEQRCNELPGDDERIQEYMLHGFKVGAEHWGVFSLYALAQAPQFLKAAI